MAATKISALTDVTTVVGADEFAINHASASRKATATEIKTFVTTPTAPTIVAVTSSFTSTGVPTATLPTGHTTNDILVLVLNSANDTQVTAPTGYTNIGPQNGLGLGGASGGVKLSIFWKRDGGSESAPTIPDTGDHTFGFMLAIRGCPTTGDPFHFGGIGYKFTGSTAGTSGKSVCHVPNCLVIDIASRNVSTASTDGASGANSDLTSFTEQFDLGTTNGVGGTIWMSSGIKATIGPVGATTVTWTNNATEIWSRIHFLPSDATGFSSLAETEIQIFLGSGADLDDLWVKPTGAKKVFAQICDGGGSGSGGNTTTTAAGGGGGGGGGYDEAWFNADDLAATITVHAGKGGAVGTALNQAGNAGVLSEFDKSSATSPLSSSHRVVGTAATAAASADGGNGGCGSGGGRVSPVVKTTPRIDMNDNTAGAAMGRRGGSGGSGTTAPVGGGSADWGGGGGESGADTDAAITSDNNGWSMRGGGGGSGGRTNTNISGSGHGGGASGVISAQGAAGTNSTRLPYGGSGGVGGGSSVVTGGSGGFPGGGGGGGAGVAAGFGGKGGDGCIVVTTYF